MTHKCTAKLLSILMLFVPCLAFASINGFSVPDKREFVSSNGRFLVEVHTIRGSGGTPETHRSKGSLFNVSNGQRTQAIEWDLVNLPVFVLVTDDGRHVVTIDEPVFADQHALVVYDNHGNLKLNCTVDEVVPVNERKQTWSRPSPMELDGKSCVITNDQFTARTERGRVIEVDLRTYQVRTYHVSRYYWMAGGIIVGILIVYLLWTLRRPRQPLQPTQPMPAG